MDAALGGAGEPRDRALLRPEVPQTRRRAVVDARHCSWQLAGREADRAAGAQQAREVGIAAPETFAARRRRPPPTMSVDSVNIAGYRLTSCIGGGRPDGRDRRAAALQPVLYARARPARRAPEPQPFSLTEARVLYELAHRASPTAAEIARDLSLDPAHLSRILKRFTTRRLVGSAPSAAHAKRMLLSLTPAGRPAFGALERATVEQIGGMLAPLGEVARRRLIGATRAVEAGADRASLAGRRIHLETSRGRRSRLGHPSPGRALRQRIRLGLDLRGPGRRNPRRLRQDLRSRRRTGLDRRARRRDRRLGLPDARRRRGHGQAAPALCRSRARAGSASARPSSRPACRGRKRSAIAA